MKVRANADIPRDAIQARAFGAEGIGLCRTEHMFFGEDKIPHMRAMILADNEKDRRAALKKLLPLQREDFVGVFKAMDGLPVTIRTLDPPLHEFLPRREDLMVEIAASRRRRERKKRWWKYRLRREACGDLKKSATLLARVEAVARVQSDARTSRMPAWASRIRKLPRCRRAPFSRRRSSCERRESRCFPKS